MKGSREGLANLLTKKYELDMRNKKELKHTIEYVVRAGFPVIEVADVVQLRKQAIDCSDRMLYYLLKATDEKLLSQYFSEREIKEYETTKFKPMKFEFPIKWEMIEVVEGTQWIGKISVKELMKLRDAQLINYNERTQRTLKRVQNKDFEYYQIYLNRNAVDAITESYMSGQYIPNTITLNLPEDAEFKYSNGTLTIKNASRLDIIDGYHRYIAMSNIFNQDSDFDYTMELRVVCFSEETAKQFIWQEDQKTKMRRLDSESFNQNSPANQVINLINQRGIYRNVIGRNNSPVDQGTMTSLISRIWFNTSQTVNRSKLLSVAQEIISIFDCLLETIPYIFDDKWSYEFTVVTFALATSGQVERDELYTDIIKTIEAIEKESSIKTVIGSKGGEISAKMISRIHKFYQNYVKEV